MKNKTLIVLIAILVVAILVLFAVKITGYGIFNTKARCVSNGYQCGDCIDNDKDGLIDYKVVRTKVTGDPDCTCLTDNTEAPCTPSCMINSNCGTNGYVGSPYCGNDSNVYRNYITYTCYNPGECAASCGSQTNPYIWDVCAGNSTNSTSCVNGTCMR